MPMRIACRRGRSRPSRCCDSRPGSASLGAAVHPGGALWLFVLLRFWRKARMTASTAIRFDDVTLGYGRHPAVHHLDGDVAAGSLTAVVGPNGAGKSTLLKGIVGTLRPLDGAHRAVERRRRRASPICRRPPRSTAPSRSRVYDLVAMGLWSRSGLFGGIGRRRSRPDRGGARGGRPDRLRAPPDRHAVRRADAARAVRPPAAAGRARDPARRALHGHRRQDHRRSARPGAALARREAAPSSPCCTISTWCGGSFPQTLLIAREPVAWGDTGRGAERRQPAARRAGWSRRTIRTRTPAPSGAPDRDRAALTGRLGA